MESTPGPTVLGMLFGDAAGQSASGHLSLCMGGDGGYYYMSAWQGRGTQVLGQTFF